MSNPVDMTSVPSVPPTLPPMDAAPDHVPIIPPTLPPMDAVPDSLPNPAVGNQLTAERMVHRCMNRMKYKNCGVVGTRQFILIENVQDVYGDDIIPPLTKLEGTITAVPNMQKQFLDYKIHWETNGLLPVSFNPEHLQVKYFKGDEQLM